MLGLSGGSSGGELNVGVEWKEWGVLLGSSVLSVAVEASSFRLAEAVEMYRADGVRRLKSCCRDGLHMFARRPGGEALLAALFASQRRHIEKAEGTQSVGRRRAELTELTKDRIHLVELIRVSRREGAIFAINTTSVEKCCGTPQQRASTGSPKVQSDMKLHTHRLGETLISG